MSISHRSDKENCILTNEYASIGDLVTKKHSEEYASALVDKALKQRININNLDKIQEPSCNEEHKFKTNPKTIETVPEELILRCQQNVSTLNANQQNICNMGIENNKADTARDLVIHSGQITSATNLILEELIDQKSKAEFQESYCYNNFAQGQSNQSSFRLHNTDIIHNSSMQETSLSTSKDLSRKRRSRIERSNQRENAKIEPSKAEQTGFVLKILEVPCSPSCSNRQDANQTQNQTMDNYTSNGFISARLSHDKGDCLQFSARTESRIMTARSNNREANLANAYRSVQDRPTAKSCENRAKTHREFSNPRDSKLDSVFSLENSMRQMGSQTYRGHSHYGKTSKQRDNKNGYLSSRTTDRSANTRRESHLYGLNTERGLITENLKSGYGELAKMSKQRVKKNEKSVDKENKKGEIKKRDKHMFDEFKDKALQIRHSNVNIPVSQRNKSSEAYKNNLESKSRGVDQIKQTNKSDLRENKASKSITSKEVVQKVMKFPNPKACLESTYYEEFMRKKKLHEKLLHPRNKNYEVKSKENIENLPKVKEINKTENKEPFPTNMAQFETGSYSKRNHHKPEDNQLKMINPKIKINSENENYFSKKEILQENKQNKNKLEGKEQVVSITMTDVSATKHQDKQIIPRVDRIMDKTIIEKTYMEKNHLKNKGIAHKPVINIKTGYKRKESEEKFVEFEQSQADSLSFREEKSVYEANVKEENLWQQILDNAILQINFDSVTQEWKKLTENQLDNKQEAVGIDIPFKEVEMEKVEEKLVPSEVQDQPNLKKSPEKPIEKDLDMAEEKVIVNGQSEEAFDMPTIREIRELEEKAAKIIQDFYKTKFCKNGKIQAKLEGSKPVIEAFSKYEILYRKINSALNKHELEHRNDELALAFSTAYSCLNKGTFSVDQIYEMVNGVANKKE